MSKAVLISIKPKWCELIANGKKTFEVRKSRPKLKPPFKCYIYQTKSRDRLIEVMKDGDLNYGEIYHGKPVFIKTMGYRSGYKGLFGNEQKVVGEFICSEIEELKRNTVFNAPALYSQSCLTRDEYFGYIGNKTAYIWHISDLKIYDKPKELSEFCCTDNKAIKNCKHRLRMGQPEYITKHGGWIKGSYGCLKNGETEWCENCISKPLKRPPQSWQYVEEREDNA